MTLLGWFFAVVLVVLAICAISEWLFNRRVDRLTIDRSIPIPPLRAVEDVPVEEPARAPGGLCEMDRWRQRREMRDGSSAA